MATRSTVGAAATFGLVVTGGYFFGPIGAAAGALVGGFLFGGGGADIEGPRLGDLSVSASTYGGVRNVGFGVHKVGGAVIWAQDIIEQKSTRTEGGGLFGGGQKITEYRYYASFAVALGEGPASGIVRVWAGEKLIAHYGAPDFTADPLSAEEIMKFYGANGRFNIRVYLGTDDQEPDPLIRSHVEAKLGEADITPAFRGTVYLVFERLPLDEFGGRIPAISAEVAWAGAAERPDRAFTLQQHPVPGVPVTFHLAVDWERGFAFLGNGNGIRRVRLIDGQEDMALTWEGVHTDGAQLRAAYVDAEGLIWCYDNEANYTLTAALDPDTLTVVRSHDGGGVISFPQDISAVNVYTLAERDAFVFTHNAVLQEYSIIRSSTMEYVHVSNTIGDRIHSMIPGAERHGWSEMWLITNGGATATLRRVRLDYTTQYVPAVDEVVGMDETDYTLTPSMFGGSGTIVVTGPINYEVTLGAIVMLLVLDGSDDVLAAWHPEDGVLWQLDWDSSRPLPRDARITQGRVALQDSTWVVYVLDTLNGTVLTTESGYTSTGALSGSWYDARTHSIVSSTTGGTFRHVWPGRISRQTVSLSSVVTALCARARIPAADLDVSELSDSVHGFALGRQMPTRGALELLAVTYNFDCCESDYKLTFKKRGRVSTRTIQTSDLVPIDQDVFLEERQQDVDLPLRVSVTYQDVDRDAEVATQTAQRIASPDATMYSSNQTTLELPITLTAQEAKELVLRQCFGPWAERLSHTLQLTWEHLDLDPGDVITLTLAGGRAFTIRILQLELGADLKIRIQSVVEVSSTYDTANAVTAGGLNHTPAIASPTSASKVMIADTPLLDDADDMLRNATGVYWWMAGIGQPNWGGATLYQSLDGATYALLDEGFSEPTYAVLASTLPPSDNGLYAIDRGSFQVRLVTGSLTAATESEMLDGANRALILDPDGGVEVIAFSAVTDDGNGLYTLDGALLRALRGTEQWAEGTHPVGSILILLDDPEAFRRVLFDLSEIDSTRCYRAVGRGADFRNQRVRSITPAGRDLKPYRPVGLASDGASWGSTITLSWVRQTRLGGVPWLDSRETVPLAEDSEEYELEILDGPGGAVVRTVTGLGAAQFAYTAGMQSTDFMSAQSTLTFRVYQVSAQVGRGFVSAEKTVDT